MKRTNTFQNKLLKWFRQNRRPLPWRENYEPYRVWISEIMLQQTQMDRGVEYFRRWMERFPDIASVAAAPEEDILKAWEGLGYYNRARNIQKAAQVIMEEHGGEFPSDPEAVHALPGVGRYTAGAICSIAFNLSVPAVDANVERVFARIYDLDTPVKEGETQAFIWDTAELLIPEGEARNFNQALMEFGALVCNRNPRCSKCPVADDCEALHAGVVFQRPVSGKTVRYTQTEVVTGVLVSDGKVFIQKRPPGGTWAGLWEFPGGSIEKGETAEQALVREYAEELNFKVKPLDKLTVIRHGYTRFKVALHCYLCRFDGPAVEPRLGAALDYRWASVSELDDFAFPSAHRKLIDLLKRDLRFWGA